MNRRHFLGVPLYGALVYILSRLPWTQRYGAVFRVTYVDKDHSGEEYSGHLGAYVYNATRCCTKCQVIFGAWKPGGDVDNGPGFADHELTPVNAAAARLLADIQAHPRYHRHVEQDPADARLDEVG